MHRILKRLLTIASLVALSPSTFVGQCPLKTNAIDKGQPVPAFNATAVGDKFATGKVPSSGSTPSGVVQICVDDKQTGDGKAVPLAADGYFSVKLSGPLTAEQKITAQYTSSIGGNPSDVAVLTVTNNPITPVITPGFVAGTTQLAGSAQSVVAGVFRNAAQIYVCLWRSLPKAGPSLDCRTGSPGPATLVGFFSKTVTSTLI